jgi:hypothetical protein
MNRAELQVRHAPVRELSPDQLREARLRGYITARVYQAEMRRRNLKATPTTRERLP